MQYERALKPCGASNESNDTAKAMAERQEETCGAVSPAACVEGPARCSGALTELAVADVVQLLQLIGRSAVMTVTVAHRGTRSRLWCAEGAMIDAESGRLRGEAAAYRILSLDDGWLEAELRHEERPRTIFVPTQRLLLEAARRKDETLALERKLGGVRCCYRLVREPEPEQRLSPTAAELRLLGVLASTPELGELLAESELGDLETLLALERWFEAGYLARVGVRSEPLAEATAERASGSSSAVAPAETSARPSEPEGGVPSSERNLPLPERSGSSSERGELSSEGREKPPAPEPAGQPQAARALPGRQRPALLAGVAALLMFAAFAAGYVLRGSAAPALVSAGPRAEAREALEAAPGEAHALSRQTPPRASDVPASNTPASTQKAVLAASPRELPAEEQPGALEPAVSESAGATEPSTAGEASAAGPTARISSIDKPAARRASLRARRGSATAVIPPPLSEPRVRVIGATEPSVRVLD